MNDDWKEDTFVHYVSNDDGKKMWFRLKPAREGSEKAPIYLILHGHGTTSRPTLYGEIKWNVIAPMDNFGEENKGSWWIGENGDFSTSELLSKVVTKSKEILNSDKDVILCIYGSSMGRGVCSHGASLQHVRHGPRRTKHLNVSVVFPSLLQAPFRTHPRV